MEQGVHGEFFQNKVLHGFRSEQEKRPIYVDQDWVRIRVVGLAQEIVERKANEEDKKRFPEAWERYEKGLTQATQGTLLESWPRMTPGMVATLKGLNFFTVEDVANASDLACQKIGMGGYQMREDAQKYLNSAAQASAVAEVERLQAANEALAADNAALREEMKEIKELLVRSVEARAENPAVVPVEKKRKAKVA